MSDEIRPGFWAVIPAQIRYDDRLPPNAKLLYAEISSLIGADGFCWATDDYFAQLYQFSERSVRRLLAALRDAGYIRVEEERGQHGVMKARRIFAAVNPLQGRGADFTLDKIVQSGQPCPKRDASLDKIVRSLDKTVQSKGRIQYKKDQVILPESPRTAPRTIPSVLPERFEAFWNFYRRIPGEGGRARNEKRTEAVRAWDRLAPDDALVDRIGHALKRQLATREWRAGVGIPMAATYLNQRRWEDAEELPADDELLRLPDEPDGAPVFEEAVEWV